MLDLIPSESGKPITLSRRRTVLGSSSEHSQVVLEGAGIDPAHCRIRIHDRRSEGLRCQAEIRVLDNASRVIVNGEPVRQGRIRNGDCLVIGESEYQVSIRTPRPTEPSPSSVAAAPANAAVGGDNDDSDSGDSSDHGFASTVSTQDESSSTDEHPTAESLPTDGTSLMWRYRLGQTSHGPVSTAEMVDLARSGFVTAETEIQLTDQVRWIRVRHIPEINAALPGRASSAGPSTTESRTSLSEAESLAGIDESPDVPVPVASPESELDQWSTEPKPQERPIIPPPLVVIPAAGHDREGGNSHSTRGGMIAELTSMVLTLAFSRAGQIVAGVAAGVFVIVWLVTRGSDGAILAQLDDLLIDIKEVHPTQGTTEEWDHIASRIDAIRSGHLDDLAASGDAEHPIRQQLLFVVRDELGRLHESVVLSSNRVESIEAFRQRLLRIHSLQAGKAVPASDLSAMPPPQTTDGVVAPTLDPGGAGSTEMLPDVMDEPSPSTL